MIAKHFNALSMCPRAKLALGDATEMVCHCLLVETKHGLVLVDAGLFAEADWKAMRTPGLFRFLMRVGNDHEATAAKGIERLGYKASDVRHVVCTHLDLDHCGGISDFPNAEIHVTKAEHDAAERRGTMNERRRYIAAHFAHGPKWNAHVTAGETWKGFSAVRALSEDEPDLLIVPLAGHTRGHAAVAVRTDEGWLLHCGDAYFHRDEMTEKAKAPFGFEVFQSQIAIDDRARRDNQRRLRELKAADDDVKLFCAHSKQELDEMENKR